MELERIPDVLIVDDDPETLDVMKLYLQDIARVKLVTSGRQALEYMRMHRADIILLDVEMPMMDGFKTLEQLRNLTECINVPVVLVTGKNDKYTVLMSMSKGVDGYLVKPVEKETLQAKVKEVLQNRNTITGKKTVLAIDDDMAFLKLINNYIQDRYNVVMINSAKLAMEYLIKHVPDVILLDYQMPLYNGVNVLSMLQKNVTLQRVPVIILSGSLDMEAMQQCAVFSPAGYLAKPVEKEMLCESIEKALRC